MDENALGAGIQPPKLALCLPGKLKVVGEKFQMGNGKWEIELAENP